MPSVPRTDNKILPVKSNGSLTSILSSGQTDSFADKERILQIAGQLQTSLNVEEIISHFSNEISPIVAHDHLNYINEKLDVNATIGKRARYSCTYELTINENKLGIISLTRSKKFTDQEIEQLESLICALVSVH